MNRTSCMVVCLWAIVLFLLPSGCSKKVSDPAERAVGHIQSILKILKDKKDNCDSVVEGVEKYINQHAAELEELNQAEQKMSDEEKKQFREKIQKQVEGIAKEMMSVMMEIGQKCPEQMAKISQAMDKLK